MTKNPCSLRWLQFVALPVLQFNLNFLVRSELLEVHRHFQDVVINEQSPRAVD